MSQPTYSADCALLGLGLECTLEQAKAAFRKKCLQTHPDRPGGDAAAFRAVKAAYDRLIDFIPKRAALRQQQEARTSVFSWQTTVNVSTGNSTTAWTAAW